MKITINDLIKKEDSYYYMPFLRFFLKITNDTGIIEYEELAKILNSDVKIAGTVGSSKSYLTEIQKDFITSTI